MRDAEQIELPLMQKENLNPILRKGTIAAMNFEAHLDAVEDDLAYNGRVNDFVESVREYYDERGFVTDRQAKAIERFYEKI